MSEITFNDIIRNFAYDIVDIFDNFLVQREISIPCEDPEEAKERNESDANKFGLYGLEYYTLVDKIEEMLREHLVDEGNQETPKHILSWDECFMSLARTVAKRSKDPSTQVGACIIDPSDNRIVSLGYNGFPYGCSDNEFPWTKDSADNKYLYVVHAELNAILSAKKNLNGCKLYVTHHPCNECMKAIIQSGIREIIYDVGYKEDTMITYSSTKMAKAAGVTITRFKSDEDSDNIEIINGSESTVANREFITKRQLDDYKEFVDFMLDKLISKNGYVTDTGSIFNVMPVACARLDSKIRKHPKLWKKYFMIG